MRKIKKIYYRKDLRLQGGFYPRDELSHRFATIAVLLLLKDATLFFYNNTIAFRDSAGLLFYRGCFLAKCTVDDG